MQHKTKGTIGRITLGVNRFSLAGQIVKLTGKIDKEIFYFVPKSKN